MKMPLNFPYLPDECWELVFRCLGHGSNLESVSMVCKQFKSITSRLQFSLAILDPTIPLLPKLFKRFSRLKMLDLSHLSDKLEEGLLHQISQSGLDLDSINLSNQRTLAVEGLQELGSKMRNLRVLICSNIGYLHDSHLVAMAYFFPLLHELDISFPLDSQASDFGISKLSSMLENLHKINLSGNYLITDRSILSLCQNCVSLEEISFSTCFRLTQLGIASAISLRPSLNSICFDIVKRRIHGPGGLEPQTINLDLIDSLRGLKRLTAIDLSNSFISDELLFSIGEGCHMLKKLVLQGCCNFTIRGISSVLSKCQSVQCLDLGKADFLTDQSISKLSMFLGKLTSINLSGCCQLTNAAFFTLTRNCPLLIEIKMERTYLGVEGEQEEGNSLMENVANTQVKGLYLGHNVLLDDASVIKLASICPSLELLDLNSCGSISGECTAEVLQRCCDIRHLNLARTGVKLFDIDFDVSQLKVLKLSGSRIDDGTLSTISRRCCGLLHLDIKSCINVTEKGVGEVLENCMALRELNLENCGLVCDDFVSSLSSSRPTLRKIVKPSGVGVSF